MRRGGFLCRMAAPVAAVAGCLQPAIDPVFLTLLTTASHVAAVNHGWIVGVSQAGSGLGALGVWLAAARLPRGIGVAAAALALVCALLTPFASGLGMVLVLRALFGLGLGAIYALAMAIFAARRPSGAYATVLLAQSLVATLLSLAMPMVAMRAGETLALGLLAVAPGLAMLAMLFIEHAPDRPDRPQEPSQPVPLSAWSLACATFWFICATMMVWSLSGALAMRAGLSEAVIGDAVALGSLAAAGTALAVMRERVLLPLWLSALLAGAALLAPLVMTRPGAPDAFMLAMVVFNIGFTAMSIRCSGLASAMSRDPRFRMLVAATHSLGMAGGPMLGSVAMWILPGRGLLLGAGFAVAAGIASVVVARLVQPRPGPRLRHVGRL